MGSKTSSLSRSATGNRFTDCRLNKSGGRFAARIAHHFHLESFTQPSGSDVVKPIVRPNFGVLPDFLLEEVRLDAIEVVDVRLDPRHGVLADAVVDLVQAEHTDHLVGTVLHVLAELGQV